MVDECFFPLEVTCHVPRITLVGHKMVHVEQHSGLAVYQSDLIDFRSNDGQICITGHGMRFQNYSASEATITGEIDSVSMKYAVVKGGGKG